MNWYVAHEGATFGPFTFDVLVKGVRDGELTPDHLVWSDGMHDWQPARIISGLFAPPSPPPPPAVSMELCEPDRTSIQPKEVPSANAAQDDHQRGPIDLTRGSNPGLIPRHWRGHLSLPLSYWGVGIVVTIGTIGLGHLFRAAVEHLALNIVGLGIAIASFLAFVSACTVWQLVGIWRSAGRYMQSSRPKVWGALARIAVFLAIVCAGLDFNTIVGAIWIERGRLLTPIERVRAHQIRLMRNDTEIELAGGMPTGTAAAFRKAIDAAPGVQIVHLNNMGGSVAEGYEIYQLVRDRRLITYTAADCVSACTIAFLGGSQRLLSTRARLGFHSLSIAGADQRDIPDINAEVRRTLLSHGAPEWFVIKALATNSDAMWYPTKSELRVAKIVTGIVDPDQFALSGITNWHNQEAVERSLLGFPLFALVRDNDPDMFKKVAGRLSEGVKAGNSLNEIIRDAQAVLVGEVIPRYMMLTPDNAVQRYWRTQVREVEYLRDHDPPSCVAYLFPQLRDSTYKLTDLVPEELVKEDMNALTLLVEEAIRWPAPAKSADVEQQVEKLIEALGAKFPEAQPLITEPLGYTHEPKRLCSAFLAFFTEVMNLPPEESAAIVRWILESNR